MHKYALVTLVPSPLGLKLAHSSNLSPNHLLPRYRCVCRPPIIFSLSTARYRCGCRPHRSSSLSILTEIAVVADHRSSSQVRRLPDLCQHQIQSSRNHEGFQDTQNPGNMSPSNRDIFTNSSFGHRCVTHNRTSFEGNNHPSSNQL
jgi:hypothetical protein